MQRLETKDDLGAQIAAWRNQGESVGLVPTMGALHAGHLALVRQARADCDRVVATIFINPLQFNEEGDLASYPHDEAEDWQKLTELGVDATFMPTLGEIYPDGFQTRVILPGLMSCLCGIHRPGHMEGVATVVCKLLIIAGADRAYFGEKDYQQLLIVTQLARDLNIPVTIVGVPTVREADGLALSSRNLLIDPALRPRAAMIYQVLQDLAARLADGRTPAKPHLATGRQKLVDAGFTVVDYLELRTPDDLKAKDRVDGPARLFAAAWLGEIRLIDNLLVKPR